MPGWVGCADVPMSARENTDLDAVINACEVRSLWALGAAVSEGLSPAEFLGVFSEELSTDLPHHHVNICLLSGDGRQFLHLGAAFRDPPYLPTGHEVERSIWSGLESGRQYGLEGFTIRHAIRSGRPMRFDDYANDPLVLETNNPDELRLMHSGLRYGLLVPLRTVDSVFGVMCAGRGQPYGPFTDAELAVAVAVTRRVAPLIQTFRQYRLELDLREEVERQRDFLAHLNAISRAVAGATEEGEVLATFAQEIRKRITCDGLEVRLLDTTTHRPTCRVFVADEANAWSFVGERPAEDEPGGRVLLHQVPMELVEAGSQSTLTVPLNARSRTIGAISLTASSGLGNPRMAEAARMFADHLGPYLDSVRLAREAEQRSREVGAASERNRLAQEIHDSVIQDLVGARGLLVDDPAGAHDLLEEAIEQSRALLWNLRTLEVTQDQLVTLLAAELSIVGAELDAETRMENELPPAALEPRQATVLHAVAKQLLANVRRHSAARAVSLRLVAERDACRLEIADNGIGMPAGSHEHRPRMDGGGAGLFIVRERVIAAGGELRVCSGRGKGTTVGAIVPLVRPFDAPPTGEMVTTEAILVEAADHERATVVLIDDHQVIREGLRRVLDRTDGFMVVGEASDGVSGIRLAVSVKPDVAVIDLHLPHRSGIEVVRALGTQTPQTRIVATSAFDDPTAVHDMLAAGAHAFVSKSASSDDLVRTLRTLLEPEVPGRVTAPPQVVVKPLRDTPQPDRVALSRREEEILELMSTDLTYREIGMRLFISEKTVQYHVHHLYDKLGVRSRAAAVSRAAGVATRA
jgi:DNA-binding NarL/FixJ family response regulator/signal transduction histidine kinase